MRGWVILHPALTKKEYAAKYLDGKMRFAKSVDAWVETDYFQHRNWNGHGVRNTREQWRAKYRPDCQMVRATLSLHNNLVSQPRPVLPPKDGPRE